MADLSLHLGDIDIEQYEHVAYEPGMVEWSSVSGTTHRFQVGSSRQFTLDKVELTEISGSTSPDASIEVHGGTTTLGTATLGESSRPDTTSASGATIEVSLDNSTGADVTAAPVVRGRIN